MTAEPRLALLRDPDKAVASLSQFRRRILEALDEPNSATGLAKRLGSTRQKVNYHLRSLENAGLVELAETRQRRGLEERVMRRVADVVLVDPTAFAGVELNRRDAVGVTGVVVTSRDLIAQAAQVSRRAADQGDSVAAATLDTVIRLESPVRLKDMLEEIAAVVARYDSEAGLAVRVATSVLATVPTE